MTSYITIKNISNVIVLFKIKTTDKHNFTVIPHKGYLDLNKSTLIEFKINKTPTLSDTGGESIKYDYEFKKGFKSPDSITKI